MTDNVNSDSFDRICVETDQYICPKCPRDPNVVDNLNRYVRVFKDVFIDYIFSM